MDCIFCKIVNKEEPAKLIHEDNDIIVIENKYPEAPIHLLLIPKTHIEWKDGIDCNMLIMLAKSIAKEKGLDTYKLIFNIGRIAHFPHIHLHMLAGWEHDIPKHNI